MTRTIMFCRKCDHETPSFDSQDNDGFMRAMNRMKHHIKTEHPLVRKPHNHIDWHYLGRSK